MAVTTLDLALFPLHTVLFPGGELALRIFEPRYLEMVRDCARDAAPFGVCLILDGDEAGAPAMPAAIGTMARIIDFSTTDDGLLGIRAQGAQRFRVVTSHVRDNGLARAQVEPWAEEPTLALPVEYQLLATILERVLEKVGAAIATPPREKFDDASWVGFRLAELLPLALRERQQLLQIVDPIERLRELMHTLPRFQSG